MTRLFALFTSISFTSGYNMVPQFNTPKRSLYFFPASLKQNVPQELYHSFLAKLNQHYDVTVYDPQERPFDFNTVYSNEILLLSHSSGANQMIDIYNEIPYTIHKKAIMIEPLDLNIRYSFDPPQIPSSYTIDLDEIKNSFKSMMEINVMDEIKSKFWKTNEDSQIVFNDTLLVLTHKESSQWNMFPVIPPIHFLKKDLHELQNVTILEEEIDEFSHFDILDRPWANALNKIVPISKRDNVKTNAYYDTIVPRINQFYNN